jgi:hypothetical protein
MARVRLERHPDFDSVRPGEARQDSSFSAIEIGIEAHETTAASTGPGGLRIGPEKSEPS